MPPRPTRPGDVLRVDTEFIEITPSRSKPDRGIVTVRSETRNQAEGSFRSWLPAVLA